MNTLFSPSGFFTVTLMKLHSAKDIIMSHVLREIFFYQFRIEPHNKFDESNQILLIRMFKKGFLDSSRRYVHYRALFLYPQNGLIITLFHMDTHLSHVLCSVMGHLKISSHQLEIRDIQTFIQCLEEWICHLCY